MEETKKTVKADSHLAKMGTELEKELSSIKVQEALLATTFKKFTPQLMKQAIFEGMMRGFTFKDFIEKNVYAIAYGQGYSLVTSIDRARKIGMRSNVVGTMEPVFEEKGDEIISCSVTVKRKFSDYIGDFSAKVYFKEYYKKGTDYNGKYTPSMWDKMPHTMIAKVAEVSALRKACPEELSQNYIEEEMQEKTVIVAKPKEVEDRDWEKELKAVKSMKELEALWLQMPQEWRDKLQGLKDLLKEEFKPNE